TLTLHAALPISHRREADPRRGRVRSRRFRTHPVPDRGQGLVTFAPPRGSFDTGTKHRKKMPVAGHIADRLNAWLAGSLPEAEAAQVRAHLASCPACEDERQLLEAGRTILRPLRAEDPRAWFATKVAARAAEVRPRPIGAPWWRVAFGGGLVAGALAAVALLTVPALQRPQSAVRDELILAQ